MQLKVKKLDPEAILPRYATEGATCFDLHALILEEGAVTVEPGETLKLRTGLSFEVPAGYVMDVYSRSGHGFKSGIRLVNCVGIIDSDYRGEVQVGLRNDGRGSVTFLHGDRVAQAKLTKVEQVELIEVESLSETERGEAGLGSTGVSA